MRSRREGALVLARALRTHGGSVAEAVRETDELARDENFAHLPGPPQLAAEGPRAAGHAGEYELLLEMILEGSLLHYGSPRVVRSRDPDLALLLGDQLYALGLAKLAELGDLEAVAELADLISLLSAAQAAGEPELADAIWRAGAFAIGWGGSDAHDIAKALARAGNSGAREALEAAVTARARDGRLFVDVTLISAFNTV